MEVFISIATFLILGLILVTPILLIIILKKLKIKRFKIYYFIIGLLLLVIFVALFAWWSDTSNLILLKHYGYNIDGLNSTEFYGKVSPDNMNRVKMLETSIMGMGWPLKAIFGLTTIIPYLIIVSIGNRMIDKRNKNAA
ncbi:MAG: hypothetical protein PHS30_03385 [Bacteroidales bacterium]|nr:hypothetical protein [Bacteroidales bacterium]